jgi:hypothetical protein
MAQRVRGSSDQRVRLVAGIFAIFFELVLTELPKIRV